MILNNTVMQGFQLYSLVFKPDTINSLHPDMLSSDQKSREEDQSLPTIKEYGKTCIKLNSNIITTQPLCANGLNMVLTPLNECKKLVDLRLIFLQQVSQSKKTNIEGQQSVAKATLQILIVLMLCKSIQIIRII